MTVSAFCMLKCLCLLSDWAPGVHSWHFILEVERTNTIGDQTIAITYRYHVFTFTTTPDSHKVWPQIEPEHKYHHHNEDGCRRAHNHSQAHFLSLQWNKTRPRIKVSDSKSTARYLTYPVSLWLVGQRWEWHPLLRVIVASSVLWRPPPIHFLQVTNVGDRFSLHPLISVSQLRLVAVVQVWLVSLWRPRRRRLLAGHHHNYNYDAPLFHYICY